MEVYHLMKKILALVLALALLISCGAVLAEEAGPAADEQIGFYQLFNRTGKGIVSIMIKDNKSDLFAAYEAPADSPLAPDDFVELQLSIPAGEDPEHRLTLTFTTDDDKTGEFKTLSIESVAIDLLDVDAVAGATPIKFGKLKQVGAYWIVNNTGSAVTSVTIKDNVTENSNTLLSGIAVDDTSYMTFEIPGDEDGSHRLTITFTTEDGKTGEFKTLSIEKATIELLNVDAVAGATPIKFGPAPEGAVVVE